LDANVETFLDEIAFGSKLLEFCFFSISQELQKILENPSQKYTKKDIYDTFLRHINKNIDWQNALRITLTLHKLIHHSGDELLQVLNSKKTAQIADFKPNKNASSNYFTR